MCCAGFILYGVLHRTGGTGKEKRLEVCSAVIFDRYFSRFLQYNANSLRVLEIDDEFSYNSDINERLMKGV